MPIALNQVLPEMIGHPKDFLRHYKLIIAGGAANANSGVATFLFADANQTVRGFTTRISGAFSRKKNRPKIRFTKQVMLNNNPNLLNNFLNVHYISMTADANILNFVNSHYPLPCNGPANNNNPNILLTSQLSGCTFGIGNVHNNQQLITHIQPNNNLNNPRVHLQTSVVGGMAHGMAAVFRRENNNNQNGYGNLLNRAAVIGIRTNNVWRFFAQTYQTGMNGEILRVDEIT